MSLLITLESCLKKNKRELFSSLYMLRDRRKENLGDGSFAYWTYPHGLEVFNILNPLYLAGVDDFGKIAVHDYILVRDGFCSLVDFFYRFSRPGGCKTVLLIHERLSYVVPKTWKKNVLTYNIQRKFEREGDKELPQSFYLCILNFDWKTNSQSLQQEVAQFRKYYGKDFDQIKFKIGIFPRGQPCCDHWKKTSSSMPVLVKEVCTEFGLDSTFYTWEEMVEGRDFHQSCYHYIAEKYFAHAYSYIDHFFLSRRCVPFGDRFARGEKGKFVIDMLANYDIHIDELQYQPCDLWPELVEMANKAGAGSSLCCPEMLSYLHEAGGKYLAVEDEVQNLQFEPRLTFREEGARLQ